jgi:hypothetical protein
MPAADERQLARGYCQRGVPVTYTEYPGLAHQEAALPWEASALAFLQARFAGLPAASNC